MNSARGMSKMTSRAKPTTSGVVARTMTASAGGALAVLAPAEREHHDDQRGRAQSGGQAGGGLAASEGPVDSATARK